MRGGGRVLLATGYPFLIAVLFFSWIFVCFCCGVRTNVAMGVSVVLLTRFVIPMRRSRADFFGRSDRSPFALTSLPPPIGRRREFLWFFFGFFSSLFSFPSRPDVP